MNAIASYVPRWGGVKELNIADQWRAKWVDEQELPENAPVHYVYAIVCMADKGYATRESGENVWCMLEGEVGGEQPEAWLKKAAATRMAITPAKLDLVGFLECKATRHNTEFEQGTVVVRPFYVLVAKTVKDLPDDSLYERRRFPLNEYTVALRARYPEILDYLALATNRYAVLRAKGEA